MHPFVASFADELVKVGAARVLASRLTPQSSNVRGYSYDPESQSLTVTYKSGGTYRYNGVPPNVAKALGRNKSTGKTINKLVKAPGYQYEKVGAPNWLRAIAKAFSAKPARRTVRRFATQGEALEDMAHRHLRALTGQRPEFRRYSSRSLMGKLGSDMTGATNIKSIFNALLTSPRPHYIHGLSKPTVKLASGDMLQYFRDNPDKLKAKLERDRKKKMAKHAAEVAAPAIAAYFSQSTRWMNKLAGVAKKQITFNGLKLKIEYEPGDIRTGRSKDGKTWERKMHASYGYIPGTKGKAADGDAIDIYLSPEPAETAPVYEIRQEKKEGGYDESKFMLGWETAARAKAAYLQHMPSWAFGSIEQVADSVQDFAEDLNMLKAAAKRPSTSSPLLTGFTDELAKEAGPRTLLRRLFHGKQTPIRLGFFERRRLAKALGVRPREVERTLERRRQMGRLARGGAMVGAAGVGSMIGTNIGERDA